jgi:hypothetical protein
MKLMSVVLPPAVTVLVSGLSWLVASVLSLNIAVAGIDVWRGDIESERTAAVEALVTLDKKMDCILYTSPLSEQRLQCTDNSMK